MGYEIDFRRRLPAEPIHDSDQEPGELPPLQLTSDQEASWQRIVASVRSDIGGATVDRYPTHLELWLEQPAMQLWYSGDVIAIELFYWYTSTVRNCQDLWVGGPSGSVVASSVEDRDQFVQPIFRITAG